MKTHEKMVEDWMKDPAFKEAYDALDEEFALFCAMLAARKRTDLTQTEIAARMGTKASAITRIEAGGGGKKHSPSINTLRRYAEAVGCKLKIEFIPIQAGSPQKSDRL
jgi:transcriptional regulator with XRE-family HTH domain